MTPRPPRQPLAARAVPCALAAALLCLSLAHAADPAASASGPTVSHTLSEVAAHLAVPPDDAKPMMRWWWFGPAVAKPELQREIAAMKAGGFGGFEIQPVYPMELDDPARGIRNVPYLSPEFLDALGFANRTGRANGLRVDMTLASGWPYGGPHIGVTQAAARLRMASVALPAGSSAFAPPLLMSGEKLVATFVGDGSDARGLDTTKLKPAAPAAARNGRGAIAAAPRDRVLVFYIASRTGQQVKRAALGAEGFVMDHLNRGVVEHHLRTVAEPLLKAFGDQPPYAVFSDSLEVYQTDWTDDFLDEFRKRRGYDLTPYLPVIFSGQGPDAGGARHDWALTQTELVNERYLTPVDDWAKAHGTRFRSQTYGEPAVSMSSNRLVALPEGEGPQFREFSFTRLATSAGHLYGRPVISAESWTWLHSPAFSATPLDMKAEADRMLLQGVNLFVGHGWPYTPPGAVEPGYSFYAAAVFNDHNPWWNVMPDVTGYLARMSYLMRQGEPANEVAVFLPNDDVYAALVPGKVSLSAEMHRHVTPELTAQILDAGQNLDYVDAESVLALGVKHPVLVLPHVTRLAPEVLAKLQDYVRGGGRIVAVGTKPSLAPGLRDAAQVGKRVAAAAGALFASKNVQLVADDGAVGAALRKVLAPDLQLSNDAADIGFVRRKLKDADIYFVANTGNRPLKASAGFRSKRAVASWIDPDSGKVTQADNAPVLDLAPYESRVIVFSDAPLPATAPAPRLAPARLVADLGRDWTLAFPDGAKPAAVQQLHSWTDDAATRYFSGEAVYTREVTLDAAQLQGQRLVLDFGQGTPLASTPKVPAGMRAMLDSPVREAAQVIVNGRRAGAVWRPPYAVDVTPYLAPGRNRIEVRVANLGLNALAGHALPDYRLLSARYGERFKPQDTQLIAPQPSGMLGPVRLMGEKRL
ncbi:glycoside hydrolase [Massilia forsythiae]|uniref:Glycoside hydrolase n=1 Tax=Massilia forsythiae TaxID=2728020 RepID=A0A7Z2ZTU7_9BURK|nr:glycosyl hydrolase [Massilia forsythiae]QJE01961.1 glycoside hydrolase [Massilia forsythiae]